MTNRRVRYAATGLLVVTAAALAWWYFDRPDPTPAPGEGDSESAVTSVDCAQCHRSQYNSWYKTYHRTMTRDATPENIEGDFANVVYRYQGLETRLTREGDAFFMETVDPEWARWHARGADPGPPAPVKFSIDRVVGSHWIQEYFHRAPNGAYRRLPVLFHIVEGRWVHSNGAFLTPDTADFWGQCRGSAWNETCLYCHNTEPSKNPVRSSRGEVIGYETTTTELGIACAACHGPGIRHVRGHRHEGRAPDVDDVVHPEHLHVSRRDEICGRCHGALVPKASMWDPKTHRDPFIPGQELTRYNDMFWSEAEQAILAGFRRPLSKPSRPEPTDGRFWGDGTPLTTALEYNGLALSKCYQGGGGNLSCLSCHTMHGDDPNYLLKPKMQTNEACYPCHQEYREKLAEHTRHAPTSAGSLCYNCHMPHQVYSLLSTHRSHRISVPDLASSVGTGKPHACNLCHLDKSLGWTREQLAHWPGQKKAPTVKLSAEQEKISEAVLALCQSDGRKRVMMAGAFASEAARQASGVDWYGSFLTRLIRDERYPAVRYLAHRGLRAAYGERNAGPFDYLGKPDQLREQLNALAARYDAAPVRRTLPYLPLTSTGLPDEAVLRRLREQRNDPDVKINE